MLHALSIKSTNATTSVSFFICSLGNDGEATALTIDKDGWLHTGDVVYTDHDGYLYVVDHLKEIIKYKGFQVQITIPYHTTS